MKKEDTSSLTPTQKAEVDALAALSDEGINTLDTPEQQDWSGARRGVFYRPLKKQLTLRLDADLIAWFRARSLKGEGYQTSINRALREYIAQHDHE